MNTSNSIICGDNLDVMKTMLSSSVDLVYLDPPFSTAEMHFLADLSGKNLQSIVGMLRPRITEIYRILKVDGSLFLHFDWRNEARIQPLVDEIFGEENLIAKIIWQRSNTVYSSRFIPHTYDVIMFYGKTQKVKYFPLYISHSKDELETSYKYIDEETGKRYRLVGLTRPNAERSNLTYEFLGITRSWRFSKEKMENELKQGRIVQSKPGAIPMYKQFMGEGKPLGDVWADLPMMTVSREMTGYPTQKPLSLLERIISMSTQEGDLVFDPFCGSGTSLVAAEKLGRKWFGIDISPNACQIAHQRIQQIRDKTSDNIFQLQDSRTLEEVRNMPHYEFESWVIASLEKLIIENPKFAQSKGLDTVSGIKVYSLAKDIGFDMELENSGTSIPVIVKRMGKIAAWEINNFAIQLKHHKRNKGMFVAMSFSKEAIAEIKKKQLDGFEIITIRTNDLIAE